MSENDFPEASIEDGFEVIEAQPKPTAPEDDAVVTPLPEQPEGPRKPRLCLMGEFSAGKSTLSNLLLGTPALPVNVTATQLPPVWISQGDEDPYRVALDDQEFDIELDRLNDVSVDDTSYVRVFKHSKFLEHCDLIDMPGISDPNMDAEVWQRVLPIADMIVWCTHATQAWRQSEAAVWSTIPSDLQAKSFLLLTRMDKILSERDKSRVVKRVAREAEEFFAGLYPISLTRAMAGRDDPELWAASGAEAFHADLLTALDAIHADNLAEEASRTPARDPNRVVAPMRIKPRPLTARRPSRNSVSL